jgi:hypothetical protein
MSAPADAAPAPADAAPAPAPRAPRAPVERWDRERFEEMFRRGVFLILMLVLLVATLRAYMALERAIVTWFEYQYVPLAQAAFSLLLLGLAAWLIRSYVIARAR